MAAVSPEILILLSGMQKLRLHPQKMKVRLSEALGFEKLYQPNVFGYHIKKRMGWTVKQ